MWEHLSDVAISNLFTAGVAAARDPRQRVPPAVCDRPPDVRILCGQLILEEALETLKALGLSVQFKGLGRTYTIDGIEKFELTPTHDPNLADIVDGCCDTIYVAVGCMVKHGVPDLPHLAEVCRANDAKFPGGVATMHPTTGKYLKPAGWRPPDHPAVFNSYKQEPNLVDITFDIIKDHGKT